MTLRHIAMPSAPASTIFLDGRLEYEESDGSLAGLR